MNENHDDDNIFSVASRFLSPFMNVFKGNMFGWGNWDRAYTGNSLKDYKLGQFISQDNIEED